jgi:hypothetical protein
MDIKQLSSGFVPWLGELMGASLCLQVDLFTQVDKATGRIVDLMFCFNALNGTVVYSNAYATGLVMAVLALAVGRHLPDTLAFGRCMGESNVSHSVSRAWGSVSCTRFS